MTQLATNPTEPIEALGSHKTVSAWSANVLLVLTVILLVFGLLAGTIFWRFHQQHLRAMADVQAEVARIQAAGEPITAEDFARFHRVPQGTTDTTPLWLEAIRLAVQRKGPPNSDLPYVGLGGVDQLRPSAVKSLLPASEAYLAAFDDAVSATRRAAAAKGECRYPMDFTRGANANQDTIQNLRQLSRLLALRSRVSTHRGRDEEAIESIELLLALGRSMENQPAMNSQLVRLPLLDLALMELEFLISERSLSEEQLLSLQNQLDAIPMQGPTKLAILGERGVGYHAFHHMSPQPAGGKGKLERPADCRVYLDMMDDMLAAADKPAADRMREVLQVGSQFNVQANSLNPWDRSQVALSMQALPAIQQLFHAGARLEAERDSAAAGIAFRRFQLEHGRAPASLGEMTPEFLPAVPTDPFRRGAPLTFVVTGNQFAIYSVGLNGIDDRKLLTDPETQDDTGMAAPLNLPMR